MKRLGLFVLVTLSFTLRGQNGHAAPMALNYDDLEFLVKSKNKKVAATTLELRGVEKRLGYFKRSFIPTGEISVGQEKYQSGPYETMSDPLYSVRANVNLFRGGRDILQERSRRAQKLGMEMQSLQVMQQELYEVRAAFWNLIYLRETKDLYEKTIDQNRRNLGGAIRRINAGLATRVDKLEFEIADTQLKQDLARIVVAISTTERTMAALLALGPETQFETVATIPHQHDDNVSVLSLDVNMFRDVRLELSNQQDFEAQGKILKRWWTPRLDVYAESILYNFRERNFFTQNDRIDNAMGIQLSFDFDGFQGQYDGEALMARSAASKLRADQIKIEAEASFNTAKQELELIHELIHEGEKSVEKGQEYLSATQSEYARGVKNSVDVLSATLKQLEFRRRFVELRRDYAIARAQVEALMTNKL